MNNKTIPQVQKLKYLGIIIDYKLTFRDHMNYIAEKCTKLIFVLAKLAKINWGLGHKALWTIYLGGILPLLLYGAPVWIRAMEKEKYKNKIARVQRLINIKMAKAYRTVSSEALCVITGMTRIHIKIEDATELYNIGRGNSYNKLQIDHDKHPKQWFHPADSIIAIDTGHTQEHPTHIHVYTDGRKLE